MVKDGEIVYPGTELTQSGELPPRKGIDFEVVFFSSYICSFLVKMKFHIVIELWFIIICLYCLWVLCFELNTVGTDLFKVHRRLMSKPSNEGLDLSQPFKIKLDMLL